MRYQTIFQFPESYFESLDDILEFESRRIASMPKTCDVDGYDFGSGTVNFFVDTDSPLAALKHFRTYLGTNKVEKKLRVSYRDVDGDSYTNIWPFRDPRPFDLIYPDGIDPFSAKSKRNIPKRSAPGVSKFETPAAEDRLVNKFAKRGLGFLWKTIALQGGLSPIIASVGCIAL
ncbi:MAG: hypothetical protein AAF483_29185, partial [Planctomycetota bacterium]